MFFLCIGLHVLLKLNGSTEQVLAGICWAIEWQVLLMCSANRSHSTVMDGHRVSRLARGVTWTFTLQNRQIAKSSRFKSGVYGGQSVGVQNSANSLWMVLAVWASMLNPPKDVFSVMVCTSSGPRVPHGVSKALGSHRCLTRSPAKTGHWRPKSARPAVWKHQLTFLSQDIYFWEFEREKVDGRNAVAAWRRLGILKILCW